MVSLYQFTMSKSKICIFTSSIKLYDIFLYIKYMNSSVEDNRFIMQFLYWKNESKSLQTLGLYSIWNFKKSDYYK